MNYLLGVDGGGTGTTAMVATVDGQVLGIAKSGAANHLAVGRELAQNHIHAAVHTALENANVMPSNCLRATFGLAALGGESDAAVYGDILRGLGLGGQLFLESDVVIAWAAATGGQAGIGVIAGTGSSCYGINAAGVAHRALGWDIKLADQGSGYWIGLMGLQTAIKAFDGRIPSTQLLPAMLQHYGLKKAEDMLTLAYDESFTKARIASFAQVVIACAEKGDPYAQQIVAQTVQELAQAVIGTARKLDMLEASFPVGLIGGVFKAGDTILKPLGAEIRRAIPHAGVRLAPYSPVVGALIWGEYTTQKLSLALLKNLRESSATWDEQLRAK